ncbi:uracil-DNA glycosylase [Marinicrinis lubricantis]|uniref:Uracil-DNA glycosylase n=1 Tax=Marinicrinis lubricantis TaxID=2086470 RepID=A0ABW1IVB6_9BACL
MMEDWKPMILKEDSPPREALNCDQCGLAEQHGRFIWGEGNPDAPIFVIMDNPGAREDREGAAFVCGTRQTLQLGLREAGVALDEIYVSYLVKRRPVRKYDKPHAREACLGHLKAQLEEQKPKLLLGLGNVVIQALIAQEEEVKNRRGKWLEFEGIPIAFSYHPLAVRRRPVLMKHFVNDLKFAASGLSTDTSRPLHTGSSSHAEV